jgi:hypothetical protein
MITLDGARTTITGAALTLALACALAAPAGAAGGTTVGVRYGWANATGRLFRGGPDLKSCNLVGVQLGLPLLPLIRVEVAGEYVSQPFSFDKGVFDGIEAAGKGDYEDLTLLLTAKLDFLSLPAIPLKLYGGGGASVHYANVEVNQLSPLPGRGPLEDAIKKVTGKSTEVGWHAVAGARLAVPALPFQIFVEGRYQDPFRHERGVPTTKSVYAGLDLAF